MDALKRPGRRTLRCRELERRRQQLERRRQQRVRGKDMVWLEFPAVAVEEAAAAAMEELERRRQQWERGRQRRMRGKDMGEMTSMRRCLPGWPQFRVCPRRRKDGDTA